MDFNTLKQQMLTWRHELHQCPEEAMKEFETSEYVAKELEKMGFTAERGIGGTGVVASLKVGDGAGVVGLRADMDALEFQETADLPYRSRHDGWMHACGHDGHMSMLLGAAMLLKEEKGFNGTVRFVFQPGEEPGLGARAMVEDGLLERFPMDEIYGMHNDPQFPLGTLRTRAGGAKASEDDFEIRIHGKGSHASSPHMSKDPIVIAAEIIVGLQTIVSRTANPLDAVVVSCTDITTDGIRNSIPSNVTISGDVRCFKPENQDMVERQMHRISAAICSIYDAECEVLYSREFIPTVNDPACVDTAVAAAAEIFGKDHVNGNCDPVTSSEDFAVYETKIPGCYAFLGCKEEGKPETGTALHNPTYDFNDDALLYGARYYAQIVKNRLK